MYEYSLGSEAKTIPDFGVRSGNESTSVATDKEIFLSLVVDGREDQLATSILGPILRPKSHPLFLVLRRLV